MSGFCLPAWVLAILHPCLFLPTLQGDLQKVQEHLCLPDRSSLLSEIQALRAQLRMTHLQNQEKLQQLCAALTSTEARGSQREHQLRRQGECCCSATARSEVTPFTSHLLLLALFRGTLGKWGCQTLKCKGPVALSGYKCWGLLGSLSGLQDLVVCRLADLVNAVRVFIDTTSMNKWCISFLTIVLIRPWHDKLLHIQKFTVVCGSASLSV